MLHLHHVDAKKAAAESEASWHHGYSEGLRHGRKEAYDEITRLRTENSLLRDALKGHRRAPPRVPTKGE